MTIYLNGEYMPASEAKISPYDRGFLFGDGIYDLTPSYGGKMVGFELHVQRMNNGLKEIGISGGVPSEVEWYDIAKKLSERNGGGDLGIYFHISRGDDGRRFQGFSGDTAPTIFCMTVALPDSSIVKQGLKAISVEDLRWRRCNVKSTALLGNVLHFQEAYSEGLSETLLYNAKGELTEASTSNVFIVKDGVVSTPSLDSQKLPGITRHIVLESLRSEGSFSVEERVISMDEVNLADEVWITNSGMQIAPIIELNGKAVGSGEVGEIWKKTMQIYETNKFEF